MGLICISAAAATRQRSTSAGLSCWMLLLWLLALPFAGSAAAGTGPGTELRIVPGLEEPLVARAPATAEEAAALTTAVEAFQSRAGAGDDLAALNVFEHFLQQYPDSVWRVALQTDLGLAYYQHGYFSKAITAFEQAWQAGQNEESPLLRALTDRAAGELARMHARLGHAEALAGLLDALDGRPVSGPATEALAGAKEGLWAMRHDPGVAYLCGPMALKNLLLSQRPDTRPGQFLDDFRSSPNGVSLAEVARLADQAGFPYRLIRREPGQAIPVPSIVHWKVSHFAAIVGAADGRLHVQDPTFGADLWVTPQAIDAEASGYFLVPEAQADTAWQPVTLAEAGQIRGMGYTGSNDPRDTTPQDDKAKPDSCQDHGLCGYNFTEMVVSLTLRDTPIGYAPPRGPAAYVSLTYNQREASQPAVFGFFNVGPKWSLNWLSYIQDDPNAPGANVTRVVAGGGSISYSGYQAATGAFAVEAREAATLVRIGTTPVRYERRLPDGSREIYAQSDGATSYPRRLFLSQRLDAADNAVTLAYDTRLRLTTLTDATGRDTRFAYERSDRPLLITRITDPFGRSAQLNYDTAGRLVEIIDVLGLSSQFGYDSASLINTLTTPYGTTRFTYGENGSQRWIQATDPLGYTERLEYRHGGSGMSFSDPVNTIPQGIIAPFNSYLDGRNSFYWDKHAYALAGSNYSQARIRHWTHLASNTSYTANTIESVKFPLERRIWMNYPGQPNCCLGTAQSGTLDKPNRIGRVLDDGTTQLTQFEYNGNGQLTRRIDPLGRETRLTYAANQIDVLRIEQRSAGSFVPLATFSYDARHRPLTFTDAAGQTTTFTYNAAGQITSATDALGQQTQYEYDALGYLGRIVDANGVTAVSFTYDGFGRIATRTDSEGHSLGFEYDALDRPTRVSYPDGTATLYGWQRLDLVSVTDRLGRVTRYQYDANRQRIAETDPLGRVTRYGHYPNGTLKTLTDANGNVTTWERDLQSRLTARVDAVGQRTAYAYESSTSRLHARTDALGQVSTYGYARDDRLTALDYTQTRNATPAVRFDYDAEFARLVAMRDGTGTTTFQYVAPGSPGALQLAGEDGPYQNDTVAWTYDGLGRPATRTVDSQTDTYTYDALGRLTEHQTALGTLQLDYLGETGQRLRQTLAGTPIATTFDYADNLHDRQLIAIDHGDATGRYAYARDALGKLLRSTETTASGPPQTRTYQYDAADRLLGVSDDARGPYTYTYDALDNRLSAQSPQAEQRAGYDALNQLSALDGQSYTYDANGNLLNDGSRRYAWDAENRLIGITYANGRPATALRYDGLGRRLAIVDAGVLGSSETRFLWCGGPTPCQARDGNDRVLSRYYPHGEVRTSLGTYGSLYYVRDQLGSVRALRTRNGQTLRLPDYDPWGQPGNFVGVDFRFAGMYYHPASGLYLTPYRAYDPRIGRWLSRDPIGEAGGINLYGYVGADPVNRRDPSGLTGETLSWCAGGPVPCAAGVITTGLSIWLMSDQGQEAMRTLMSACAAGFDGMFNGSGESGEGDGSSSGSDIGDQNASPTPPDDEDDANQRNRGEKGKTFRGGKRADRDKWYGQNNSEFQRWWHREGKDDFNAGQDIQDAQNARAAREYWEGLGKPRVK